LALVPGFAATVQRGRWYAGFALDEAAWNEQTFLVLP